MKLISILVTLAACASSGDVPDLAYGPHDQVTSCDPAWSRDYVAPSLCDFACRIRPAEPTIGARCDDPGRPCLNRPACRFAQSPSSRPKDCEMTFYAGPGVTGCCHMRTDVPGFEDGIPTFFACR